MRCDGIRHDSDTQVVQRKSINGGEKTEFLVAGGELVGHFTLATPMF